MRVYILPHVHAEIMHYVHKSHIEISGLGRIEKNSKGEMVVTKVYLIKQENGPASTDICESAAADLMYESREDKGALNFWWHSHVNMGAFWSGTDMATIKQFGGKGYLLSTVFNKRGEHQTAYYQAATDFLPEVWIDKIDTHVSYIPTSEQITAWDAEYTTKCAPKVYASTVPNSHVGKRWDGTKWVNKEGVAGIGSQGMTRVWGGNYFDQQEDEWLDEDEKNAIGAYYRSQERETARREAAIAQAEPAVGTPKDDPVEQWDEQVGMLSGATVQEIIDTLKRIYYMATPTPFDQLEAETVMMLHDAYGMVFDDSAEVVLSDIEYYYNDITKNFTNFSEFEYDMLERQYAPIDSEKVG